MQAKFLLSFSLLALGFCATAQNANKAFAITGDGNNDFLWMNIRQVDLGSGQVTSTIFERSKTTYSLTNLATSKTVTDKSVTDGNVFGNPDYPTATFVAAAAFDARTGKLFFIPMRTNELRWLDVNSVAKGAQFYSLGSSLLQSTENPADEAAHITRMVIAADGNGYAISNDGNSLLRFTTGKKPAITELGGLIDADGNGSISVHNKCSSWGGDMVADAFGKLVIISANHQVFEVDINSRIATYKGAITGLPATYTTNGAAVDADGKLIVCSAITFEGYYTVDMKTLAATKIESSDVKYNASDLAGSNLLKQKEADAARSISLAPVLATTVTDGSASIFPNPVTANRFTVSLKGLPDDVYSISIADLAGRQLQNQKTSLVKGMQNVSVSLPSQMAKGSYFVQVVNSNGQVVFTDKILVQ